MKKRLEKYIESAIEYLPQSGLVNNDIINNKYSGYISSFGASVINNGFLPAYMFYNKDDHAKVLDGILQIIKKNETSSAHNLLAYFNEKNKSEYALEKIIDAATALKLTIKTYKLEKSN